MQSAIRSRQSKAAFSLVELSIVLVILGLLTGGVLSGTSLIKAAELRSVSADYSKYLAATRAFRDKYFAIPGDMSNATSFWSLGTCSTAVGATTVTTTTCNGDGNGYVTSIVPTSPLGQEPFRFWQHLVNAQIIEGAYTGTSASGTYTGSASPTTAVADLIASVSGTTQNVPRSRINGAGWTALYVGTIANTPTTTYYEGNYDNVLILGAIAGSTVVTGNAIAGTAGPIFKAEDAWNIDTKLDDGKPGTGSVTAPEGLSTGYTAGSVGCGDTAPAATSIGASSAYHLANTSSAACSLVFKLGF